MTMPARARKLALAAHLMFSVGWIGAVFAYLALGVAAVTSEEAPTVRAAWTATEMVGWYVIVPLAFASLVSGVVMALGTPWGLFRHHWVLFSLVLTAFAAVVLLLHMPTVSATARTARQAEGARLEAFGGDLFHPGIGLLVLVGIQLLNVYKPRGLTPYGWRKREHQRTATASRV